MSQRSAYAEISVFVHATEDESKVGSAVRQILPEEWAEKLQFSRTQMRGHHGNPIVELKMRVEGKGDALRILYRVLSGLSSLDATALDDEFPKHLDERGRLYLRLDKQRAFMGEYSLASGDTINMRFRLGTRVRSLKELTERLKEDRG